MAVHRGEVGLRLRQLGLVIPRLNFHEQAAAVDFLLVLHEQPGHASRDF